MHFRAHATAAVAALLGLGSVTAAVAQPIAPMRPQYNSYNNLFRPGGGNYFYGGAGYGGYGPGFGGGFGGPNQMLMQQNAQLQQQLNYNNQSMANLQTYLSTGVNPNLPITGRGATFNYLGHWYPQSRYGGAGGGFGGAVSMPRGGMYGGGMYGAGMGGPGGAVGVQRMGTAGNGVPIGGQMNRPGVGRP